MLCPICQRQHVVRINMSIGDQELLMHSCSGCDARWWDDGSGNRVPLDGVLALAGANGRRRRRRVSV